MFNEIDNLVLNQNSAIEGVCYQRLFEDRFPYDEFQQNSITTKHQVRLRKMFDDRKLFS